MTCSAPIERTTSICAVLHTPVTIPPNAAAICTANDPTPPAAPITSTDCPACTCPWSRTAWSAVVPVIGTVAASSNERFVGFGASLFTPAATYSANAPSQMPYTASPTWNVATSGPTASMRPGDVATTNADLRLRQTARGSERERHPRHVVPISGEEARRLDLEQHLTRTGGRSVDVLEVQDVRLAVLVLDDRLHRTLPKRRTWASAYDRLARRYRGAK